MFPICLFLIKCKVFFSSNCWNFAVLLNLLRRFYICHFSFSFEIYFPGLLYQSNIHFWQPYPSTDSLALWVVMKFCHFQQANKLIRKKLSKFTVSPFSNLSKLSDFLIILAQKIAKLLDALIVMSRCETF